MGSSMLVAPAVASVTPCTFTRGAEPEQSEASFFALYAVLLAELKELFPDDFGDQPPRLDGFHLSDALTARIQVLIGYAAKLDFVKASEETQRVINSLRGAQINALRERARQVEASSNTLGLRANASGREELFRRVVKEARVQAQEFLSIMRNGNIRGFGFDLAAASLAYDSARKALASAVAEIEATMARLEEERISRKKADVQNQLAPLLSILKLERNQPGSAPTA